MPMQIMLSTQVADEAWGKNALLSFHQAQATIHVTDYSAR
ncbi:aminopeptidase B, partial [Pasteurella multocida subsp. multocida str. Anand1_cattle]